MHGCVNRNVDYDLCTTFLGKLRLSYLLTKTFSVDAQILVTFKEESLIGSMGWIDLCVSSDISTGLTGLTAAIWILIALLVIILFLLPILSVCRLVSSALCSIILTFSQSSARSTQRR